MHFSLSRSLVLYSLLLESRWGICSPFATPELVEDAVRSEASVANHYRPGTATGPLPDADNLLDEKTNLLPYAIARNNDPPGLTDREKMLLWGNSYGKGGEWSGKVWDWIKKGLRPIGALLRKLVTRFDHKPDNRDRETVEEAAHAEPIPPGTLGPENSEHGPDRHQVPDEINRNPNSGPFSAVDHTSASGASGVAAPEQAASTSHTQDSSQPFPFDAGHRPHS